MQIRDRVVGLVKLRPSKVRPNPWNWRTHDDAQKGAFEGIASEVGVAIAGLVRQLDDGTYMLIDGHLRKGELERLGDRKATYAVLDLTEDEAKKLLAAYDPLGGMAGKDESKVRELLKGIDTDSKPLASLFSSLVGKVNPKDLNLDLDGEDEGEVTDSVPDTSLPPSHVRMVQLFFNAETVKDFEGYVKVLGPKYETKSLTDTILECLRRAVRREERRANGSVEKGPGR